MGKFVKKSLRVIFYIFLSLLFVGLLIFFLFESGLLVNVVPVSFDKNKLVYLDPNVKILDKNDIEIESKENKKNLTFDEIPKCVKDAFITIEDKDFYKHKGLNYKRILKASLTNIKNRKFSEGASTISQQLIKNTHLTSDKTLKRKINEVVLTKELEKNLTKNEILTAYLNAIYFGNGAFGINSASNRYFSKNANKLNLNEACTLAGIVKSPKKYSPLSNYENCKNRRNLILKEMMKDNLITKLTYEEEVKKELPLKINKDFVGVNTYYNACILEACKILNLSEKDLVLKKYTFKTYLDKNLQKTIENEVNNKNKYTSSSCDVMALCIDNKTGGISGFYGQSKNNLLSMMRQPGSTFKPIISYAPALEYNIICPKTKVLDEKTNFNGYTPKNFNDKYYGYIDCKTALAKSLNIPSIKVLSFVGVNKAKDFAKRMNIQFNSLDTGYSLALGGLTDGIKIKDLTNCYQAFANNGNYIESKFIKEIKNSEGKTIYSNLEQPNKVMKESTSYLITDMLRSTVTNGTSRKLNLENKYIAAKTGTVENPLNKNKNTDCYNISYTKDKTLCVWMGGRDMKEKGANAPSSIAREIYKSNNIKCEKFDMPKSIKKIKIDAIDYNENNIITLAKDTTPDRFSTYALVQEDNKNFKVSNNFDEIEDFNILLKKENDKVVLSFDAKKYLSYDVYRLSDKIKKLKTIEDSNKTEFLYDEPQKNIFYTYYVIAKYKNILSSKTKKSNEIKLYLA